MVHTRILMVKILRDVGEGCIVLLTSASLEGESLRVFAVDLFIREIVEGFA